MRRIDLTNQRFGKLVALYPGEPYIKPSGVKNSTWICQCDCGKQTTVRTEYLRNGHTTSCGCSAFKEDLTGKKFGRLTVLQQVYSGWECLCDCGQVTIVRGANLKNGNTQSCGCLQKERARESCIVPMIGKTFGKLTVIEQVENNRYNQIMYKCKCECGSITIVPGINLRRGITTSCGCVKSKGEMAINNWLTSHQINFKPQYSHNQIKLSSGRRPFFDFAIFDKNNQLLCFIEYNGIQHYSPGYGWNDEEHYLDTVKRDTEKREACLNLGIKLYEIPYWELENIDSKLKKILEGIAKEEATAPDIEEAQEIIDEQN